MNVEILRRERLSSGWVRFTGAVDGVRVGVRLPCSYVDSAEDKEAEAEVKAALADEYERQKGAGGTYSR